jgi:Protein of unknown function DUF262
MSDHKVLKTLSTSTQTQPEVPPRDPQPSVDRIDELARRILTGDILLPKFQRSFVWDKKQIRDLLDSILKNYPIGSVLLWQSRQELISESTIAGLKANLPRHDYPVNYLLDGQQRLSTICGALYWSGDDPKSQWNIVYDLREGKLGRCKYRRGGERLPCSGSVPVHLPSLDGVACGIGLAI